MALMPLRYLASLHIPGLEWHELPTERQIFGSELGSIEDWARQVVKGQAHPLAEVRIFEQDKPIGVFHKQADGEKYRDGEEYKVVKKLV